MTPRPFSITRRGFIGGMLAVPWVRADIRPQSEIGYVIGEPGVETIGMRILVDGGNAADALVATALAGAVMNPHQTGIGGYGAHGVFAMNGGRPVKALDANTTAPAAFTADIFKPDAKGAVPDRKNHHGWLATGVPGVIAGLKLALDEFGTMPFSAVLEPAIRLTREGFPVSKSLAGIFANAGASFQKDAGSTKLYLPGGSPPKEGDVWKNPELAEVLVALAEAESIEPFYRGDIAQRIAEGFAKNGGLVGAADLAAYRARIVEPLQFDWSGRVIHTAPLACGGFSVLQMLTILKEMKWDEMPIGIQRVHARVEAMRLAWRDRLTLLADPEHTHVPQQKLLSAEYAQDCAAQIRAAVNAGRVIDHPIATTTQGGTLNFSACDKDGNVAALTLTHGDGFGARVTVDGLGLTLGHGMSRFDPRPEHPNSPGPRKRPLHNMVPVVITENAKAIVAIGGRGGRKIPNAMFEFVTQFVVRHRPFAQSLASPRLHTEGTKVIEHQKGWPNATLEGMAKLGFALKAGSSATLSGVALEDGRWRAGMP